MKVSDHDTTKESLQVQEFVQEVRNILNKGLYEIEITSASQPSYAAPDETRLVLSLYGAQYRLYISYLGDWYYVSMTKV